MKKRNYSQSKSVQNVKRERDPIPWRYCLLTLICGLLLVGGFFFAARQHFAAVEFGLKNSKLRKQFEDLNDEKRRLLLAKEIAVSPTEIIKAARKIGFSEVGGGSPFGSPTAKNDADAKIKPSEKTVVKPSSDKNVQAFSGQPSKNEIAVKKPKTDKVVRAIKESKSPDATINKKGQNVR